MKRFLAAKVNLMIVFFFSPILSWSQTHELWGMTSSGGNDAGVIFKTDGKGDNQMVKFLFGDYPGGTPTGKLCQASNGKFYGMTCTGGLNDSGVLFEYDPATATYVKKLDFGSIPLVGSPIGSIIQASNGKLYGVTTSYAGAIQGVLFEYDLLSSTYIVKVKFYWDNDARSPSGSVIQASNGKLYGMTNNGGTFDLGVLFEFDPTTSTFTKKLDFDTNAGEPRGSLVQASNGKLYGMTSFGGSNNNGVLFEYDPNSNTRNDVMKFDFFTGDYPFGSFSLMQATNGKLYGMTSNGGINNYGIIYEFDPTSSTYSKKYDFDGVASGSNPQGSLIQASNGKLYGMTSMGGANDQGVLFEYNPDNSSYNKRLDFDITKNGSNPTGSLLQASNGKLYGMTDVGLLTSGFIHRGVLFEFDLSTSAYTKRLDFGVASNGSSPKGSLIQASNGKLYGMTNMGGIFNLGVLFEFDPYSATCTKKLDFDGTKNGSVPYGSLIQATNGKLYGMTLGGGVFDRGVIFELDPATSTYTKKVDFDGPDNGSFPYGSLIQASNGKLYGMTNGGGVFDMGVLFEFDPYSSICTKKLDFDGPNNGSYPYGSLIQAINGKLYGMTYSGGDTDMGVLFEFEPTTAIYTKKINFVWTNIGSRPYGSLIQASNGKLYGLTTSKSYGEGSYTFGSLFEYNPAANTWVNMLNFDFSKGYYPLGTILEASNGKFYGMTKKGGKNWPPPYDCGVLFEFDPTTSLYTKKFIFDGTNGMLPEYSQLIEICTLARPAIIQIENKLSSDVVNGNQWYDQNGLISGATNQVYTPTTGGSYYDIVTIDGCISPPSNQINIVLTDMEIIKYDESIKVYPNPVASELSIEIEGSPEKTGFEIIDLSGRKIYEGSMFGKTILPVKDFSPGVYIVRFKNGNNFEFRKIVKK